MIVVSTKQWCFFVFFDMIINQENLLSEYLLNEKCLCLTNNYSKIKHYSSRGQLFTDRIVKYRQTCLTQG
jgi:hypothetical protein